MKAEKTYRGPCPCGSLKSYERCCEWQHQGEAPGDCSRHGIHARARRRFRSLSPRAAG